MSAEDVLAGKGDRAVWDGVLLDSPPLNRDILVPRHASGFMLPVEVSATNGDGTQDLQVKLFALNEVTETWEFFLFKDLFTDGATGTAGLFVHPAIPEGNLSGGWTRAAFPLPRILRVQFDINQGGASPDFTFSASLKWADYSG